MNERRPATAHIKPFGLRLQPKLKEALEKSATQKGRSLNAEIVQRLEHSFSDAAGDPSAGAALEYMRALKTYEARQNWVEVVRREIKKRMAEGIDPSDQKKREFDEWEAELVYMRRALDVLRHRFMSFYQTDPEVERDIQELEAEEQRDAVNAVAEDAAPKSKRKPKS